MDIQKFLVNVGQTIFFTVNNHWSHYFSLCLNTEKLKVTLRNMVSSKHNSFYLRSDKNSAFAVFNLGMVKLHLRKKIHYLVLGRDPHMHHVALHTSECKLNC